jgi:hypothetical protein
VPAVFQEQKTTNIYEQIWIIVKTGFCLNSFLFSSNLLLTWHFPHLHLRRIFPSIRLCCRCGTMEDRAHCRVQHSCDHRQAHDCTAFHRHSDCTLPHRGWYKSCAHSSTHRVPAEGEHWKLWKV